MAVAVLVVVMVLAIAAGGVWLNTYIQSEAFRQDVEARAGESVGGTVKIEAVNFDLFRGVRLQGVSTQIDPKHANAQGALLIKVESVNCSYAWSELFQRRLKLTGLTLDKPEVVLTREVTQPAAVAPAENTPVPATATPTQVTTETPSGPTATTMSPSGSHVEMSGAEGKSMPFQFMLEEAKVNDGTVSVRNAEGGSLVDLQGVNAQADTSGYSDGKEVTGRLDIAALALPSNLHLANFSSPFTYGRGTVELKPMEASAYGGRAAGAYLLGSQGPSILDLNGKGLDVAQLTAATSSRSSAKLSGALDIQSKWRGVESGDMEGEGDAQLTNGKLEGVAILQDLSKILRINELNAPVITKAQTHFQVANRVTTFTGLQLESPIFKMTGNGEIGFDGQVNATLVLILSRDAMGKLPSQAAASFVQQPDGSGTIEFHVTGTTAHPETDLATRLLMQNTEIKNVINKALNKFFH